jgi:hypothetical protein
MDDETNQQTTISKFNLTTGQYEKDWIVLPIYAADTACLTHKDNYLIISGGKQISDVQIYNIDTSSWLSDVANMKSERVYHSCIVAPNNYLYLIGGHYLNNIQVVEESFGDTLSDTLLGSTVEMYGNDIYILGGMTNQFSNPTNKVHVIDTTTDSISIHDESLSYNVSDGASIMVNDNIYLFGGQNAAYNAMDTWQIFDTPLSFIFYNLHN